MRLKCARLSGKIPKIPAAVRSPGFRAWGAGAGARTSRPGTTNTATRSEPKLGFCRLRGGHGGSRGYLGNGFVEAILENRTPPVNIAWALNMTVAGIVSHMSALKDGELMKIPQFEF